MTQSAASGFVGAAYAAALLIPWLAAFATARVAGRRYRSIAVSVPAQPSDTATRPGARTLRGSLRAGSAVGLALLAAIAALALAAPRPLAPSPAVWPLAAVLVVSCAASGIAIVAGWRGTFAVPRADDPCFDDIARLLHARQDARDEAAARRRRAATARREAARHRRLVYDLETMHDMDGEAFEQLCGDYFAALGYTVDFTPQSGDGGIDLVLTRNGEFALAQCKRTRKSVGEPVVRDLFGALHHTGADEAFLCASSGFSPAAERWAADKPVTLIDGDEIVSTLRRRRR